MERGGAVLDAEVQAVFEGTALGGRPALTRKALGKGAAWYLATRLDRPAMAAVVQRLIAESRLPAGESFECGPSGSLEAVRRGDLLFLINHGRDPVKVGVRGTELLTGESARGMTLTENGVAVIAGWRPS